MPPRWNENRLTAKLGIDYLVIQGPLGGLSSQKLTAAVSNFGGLGSFGAHGLAPEAIKGVIDGGHFSRDIAPGPMTPRIREFMDMPKESVQGEEIMATATTPGRPPFPPFTRDSAMQKVRLAEDAWNSRDPAKVALAYTIDSRWRNRSEFINGRNEIIAFLSRKWAKELDYRLIKELWAFAESRIAVRFAYEWHDDSDHWYRSYGNENWEFSDDGLMALRFASINDIPILGSERKYHWVLGRRPDDHPGLSDLGL